MKLILFLLLAGVMLGETVTRSGVNVFLDQNSINKQRIKQGDMDKSLAQVRKVFNNINTKTSRSAPPVSKVMVLQVCSSEKMKITKNVCEDIQNNQLATNYNHSGDFFVVQTAVIGYGGRGYGNATFLGNEARLVETSGIDIDGDRVVDGYLELWDISELGNDSGIFSYTSRSINAGPSLNTTVFIK